LNHHVLQSVIIVGVILFGCQNVLQARTSLIEDREIIEKFASFTSANEIINNRIIEQEKRLSASIDQINHKIIRNTDGINDLTSKIVSMRTESDNRLPFIEKCLYILLGVFITFIAFVLWDRYKIKNAIESEVERSMKHDHMLLHELVSALYEYAKIDTDMDEVLDERHIKNYLIQQEVKEF